MRKSTIKKKLYFYFSFYWENSIFSIKKGFLIISYYSIKIYRFFLNLEKHFYMCNSRLVNEYARSVAPNLLLIYFFHVYLYKSLFSYLNIYQILKLWLKNIIYIFVCYRALLSNIFAIKFFAADYNCLSHSKKREKKCQYYSFFAY